ncbi:MAG: hypothetical protein L0H22_07160, partial [Brevibacterium aurantiacum]|nr:hypothetical protein [Brevibacterium aurantiacum]
MSMPVLPAMFVRADKQLSLSRSTALPPYNDPGVSGAMIAESSSARLTVESRPERRRSTAGTHLSLMRSAIDDFAASPRSPP